MPDRLIDIPGVGVIAFPDTMPDSAINAAAAKLHRDAQPSTPPPADATEEMLPPDLITDRAVPQPLAGVGIKTVPDDEWNAMTPQQRMDGLIKAAGYGVTSMLGLGEQGREAVDNPKTTLATAALPGVLKAARAIPTRAAAGAKFQQVMAKVGDEVVETAPLGDPVLRIAQLAERGSSMPQAVRKLLVRATDPEKSDITYREMRDFYSNISRLSADESKRLTPVMKKELGELRAAMDNVLAKTAASGGQETVYRRAMREYAMASRLREFTEKAAKWGAGLAGAGAAYNFMRD